MLLDIVHSHAVKNLAEGLNEFDGTDHQYFHAGIKGDQPQWDSKCFDYSKDEGRRFLLSNVRYWLEEFHFDGFRFDGITSMLYEHHGSVDFDHYDKYFTDGADEDAILYLALATTLCNRLRPGALLVAEDMSGMPGLCRPTSEGGIGFTHRLAMGIPDYWIKLLKHKKDEQWNPEEMWAVMTNRRHGEANIAYAESHDQALVGDKTIAFRLMDKEMYWHMDTDDENEVISRGIALHKLIRLFTLISGGEGWLNFMGCDPAQQLHVHNDHQVLAAERGNVIFIFNFNPTQSFEDYELNIGTQGDYKIILNSDSPENGGFGRADESLSYRADKDGKLRLYLPNRSCLALIAQ